MSLGEARTDRSGARIEAVLDQLFGDRTQVNNDLAGLDLMNLEGIKLANMRWAFLSWYRTYRLSLDGLDGRHCSCHVGEDERVALYAWRVPRPACDCPRRRSTHLYVANLGIITAQEYCIYTWIGLNLIGV